MADNNQRIEDLRLRVEKDPTSIAFAQLAEECRRAGRYGDAVVICRAGLAIHPGYLSARVTLGRALLELKELSEAHTEFKYVVKHAPQNLAAIRGLAETDHRLGKLPEALAHYRKALTLARNDPDLQEAVQQLADVLEPLGGANDGGPPLEQREGEPQAPPTPAVTSAPAADVHLPASTFLAVPVPATASPTTCTFPAQAAQPAIGFVPSSPIVAPAGPAFTPPADAEPEPAFIPSRPVVAEPAPTFMSSSPVVAEPEPIFGMPAARPVGAEPEPMFAPPSPGEAPSTPASAFGSPPPVVMESAPLLVPPPPTVAQPAPTFVSSSPVVAEPAPTFMSASPVVADPELIFIPASRRVADAPAFAPSLRRAASSTPGLTPPLVAPAASATPPPVAAPPAAAFVPPSAAISTPSPAFVPSPPVVTELTPAFQSSSPVVAQPEPILVPPEAAATPAPASTRPSPVRTPGPLSSPSQAVRWMRAESVPEDLTEALDSPHDTARLRAGRIVLALEQFLAAVHVSRAVRRP
jgi:hypothetical protein